MVSIITVLRPQVTFDLVVSSLNIDLGHHRGQWDGLGPGVGHGVHVVLAGGQGGVGHPVPELVLARPVNAGTTSAHPST